MAVTDQIMNKALGVLFIAYIGYMALGELINESAQFTGVVGTITSVVIPIIIAVAFIQSFRRK